MVMQTGDIGGRRSTRRAFMTRSAGTLAAVGGASGLLAACGSPAAQKGAATKAASSGTVQVVNILPPQLGYAAEYIADMDGFFKKEGLTVKANTARGSAPAIQAILSGTALLSWVGWLESVIDIANKSAPLQSVAFTGRRSTLAIVSDKTKKPLAKPQDLVGNRIGIPSEGGTSETTLDLLLASNGIDTEQGAAPGDRLHAGHLRAHQEGPDRRASSSAPRRRSSSASPSPTRCSCTRPTTSPTG